LRKTTRVINRRDYGIAWGSTAGAGSVRLAKYPPQSRRERVRVGHEAGVASGKLGGGEAEVGGQRHGATIGDLAL
jgi:hypothetical protein